MHEQFCLFDIVPSVEISFYAYIVSICVKSNFRLERSPIARLAKASLEIAISHWYVDTMSALIAIALLHSHGHLRYGLGYDIIIEVDDASKDI